MGYRCLVAVSERAFDDSETREIKLANARRRFEVLRKEPARSESDALAKRTLIELAMALDSWELALRRLAESKEQVERVGAELDAQQQRMAELQRDIRAAARDSGRP